MKVTRRERLEAKVERRREWAVGRAKKSADLTRYTDRYRGDTAFNTQPGHIPERARVIRMTDKAHEHAKMAQHHEAKADGLEGQLERTVFSDDADAISELERRIAAHEATRDHMKRVNQLYRKGDAAGLAALGLDLEALRARVARVGLSWVKTPHEAWELTNLGARIRSDKARIEEIRERRTRTAGAMASGGVLIEGAEGSEYIRVTFSEKPLRAVIDVLKAAGFTWGGGSWAGRRDRLPAEVQP